MVSSDMSSSSCGSKKLARRSEEVLLAAVVVSSVVQVFLCWSVLDLWLSRPRSGLQVPVRHAGTAGLHPTLAPLDYLLYLPNGYCREVGRWPLVLFLHGSGERGSSVEKVGQYGPPRLVTNGRSLPLILVSPQCPAEQAWQPAALLRLIDEVVAEYRVDVRRVYVTGYSMGGHGTWAIAAAAPDRFAAAAPLCGEGNPEHGKRFTNLPLWVFHGELDDVVPVKASQEMVDAVRAAGGNVVLTVYPGEGHGICDRTYSRKDFWQWLLKQRRPDNNSEPANVNIPSE